MRRVLDDKPRDERRYADHEQQSHPFQGQHERQIDLRVELAMMAIESRAPGLVARYAVSASVPVDLTRHWAGAAQDPIKVSAATMTTGMLRPAWWAV